MFVIICYHIILLIVLYVLLVLVVFVSHKISTIDANMLSPLSASCSMPVFTLPVPIPM